MQQLRSRSTPEHTSIAELYQRYWLILLSNIRQQVSTQEDGEDILLEVFLAALESNILVTLEEKQQLAWLRRVAQHKCIDYHRRSTRRPAIPLEAAVASLYEDEMLAPEQIALRREEQALLRNRLASLPDHQQEVLSLRFGEGLRCAEIARRTNKSEGAIRTLLSRSLNLLRSIYDKGREESFHE